MCQIVVAFLNDALWVILCHSVSSKSKEHQTAGRKAQCPSYPISVIVFHCWMIVQYIHLIVLQNKILSPILITTLTIDNDFCLAFDSAHVATAIDIAEHPGFVFNQHLGIARDGAFVASAIDIACI